jgi:recombination protein RecR
MVLHLLRSDTTEVDGFTQAIAHMRHGVSFCRHCHNVADTNVCAICVNSARDRSQVCIVENIRDVMAIESTQQYNGLYHVLGGILSPLDGVGPDQLHIQSLVTRLQQSPEIKELIMALSPTLEGDTTVFYISKQVNALPVKITAIARGISFGGELEYADEMTLARSIAKRLPIDNYVNVSGKQ